jgi:hypothetical protein
VENKEILLHEPWNLIPVLKTEIRTTDLSIPMTRSFSLKAELKGLMPYYGKLNIINDILAHDIKNIRKATVQLLLSPELNYARAGKPF